MTHLCGFTAGAERARTMASGMGMGMGMGIHRRIALCLGLMVVSLGMIAALAKVVCMFSRAYIRACIHHTHIRTYLHTYKCTHRNRTCIHAHSIHAQTYTNVALDVHISTCLRIALWRTRNLQLEHLHFTPQTRLICVIQDSWIETVGTVEPIPARGPDAVEVFKRVEVDAVQTHVQAQETRPQPSTHLFSLSIPLALPPYQWLRRVVQRSLRDMKVHTSSNLESTLLRATRPDDECVQERHLSVLVESVAHFRKLKAEFEVCTNLFE
jgi:hypothetical protein